MHSKHTRRTTATRLSSLSGRARGFTLVEMVVAIGAVGLVAVGLAAIFNSVGKTVSGGRRVSQLNTYSSLIESQMRRDFEHMSREGFLVIRQQWTDGTGNRPPSPDGVISGDDWVRISKQDDAPRARRIDEIQFVINGEFSSVVQPLVPSVEAKSGTSVVYYGHGQLAPYLTTPSATGYLKKQPSVDDTNQNQGYRLGEDDPNFLENPNLYAGDWTVLRHQTLLMQRTQPEASMPVLPTGLLTPGTEFNVNSQLALRPAMTSMFRAPAWIVQSPETTVREDMDGVTALKPMRSSGIVDIVNSNLHQIKAVATLSQWRADQCNSPNLPEVQFQSYVPTIVTASHLFPSGRPPMPIGSLLPLDLMHQWMSDTLPTDSRNAQTVANKTDFFADQNDTLAPSPLGYRMRYEPGPTDMLASLSLSAATVQREKLVRRADQLALCASNFLPRCTDFMVDWSFGQTDAQGKVIWHGIGTYLPQTVPPMPVPAPYPATSATTASGYNDYEVYAGEIEYSDNTTRLPLSPQPYPNNRRFQVVTDRLIYGYTPTGNESALTSYFGWSDPTWIAEPAITSAYVSRSTVKPVMPWPWPRLVRVTVTLSDPIDPTQTGTFQFVFDLPADPGSKGGS